MKTDQFQVPEMSCQHCVSSITKEVSAVPGVTSVKVNLADKTVKVEHAEDVAAAALIAAINEAGFEKVAVLV